MVLDIPLLFETGREKELDHAIVVSADDGVQRKRALARPGMTEEKLASILARQMPDAEKRRRADFVIENSGRLEHLRLQVDVLKPEACGNCRESKAMREIVLDTETTGLDPCRATALWKSALLKLFNHIPTEKTYHSFINPQRDVPREAEAVHGLGDAFLKDKPVFANIADEFLEFIGDTVLVIHNASFDVGFLNAELGFIKRPPILYERDH